MQRLTFLYLLLAICISVKSQTKNPFLFIKFDKVIICDFENDGENYYPIVDNKGQLTAIVKKHAQLDLPLIRRLNYILGQKSSYGKVRADCFEPHLGILYYKNNHVIAQIDICLDCNVLSSSITIPAQKQGKVGKGKSAYYLGEGLSKSFRHFLNEILIKYNFSHQLKVGSHFDE